MPNYDYTCGRCGHRFEKFQVMAEARKRRKCPVCGAWAHQAISCPAAIDDKTFSMAGVVYPGINGGRPITSRRAFKDEVKAKGLEHVSTREIVNGPPVSAERRREEMMRDSLREFGDAAKAT